MPRLPTVGADDDNWGAILNEYLNFEHKSDGTHNFGIFNVLSFGAKGDGQTDDTPAIQAALNAAAAVGGTVWLTPGPNAYRCNGTLYIPPHVTLKGGYGGMRRGMRLYFDTPRGSLLHVYTPGNFIVMNHDSILDGVEIYYPNQVTQGTPTPFGWTISMPSGAHGCTIRNITATNPYQFIYANADGFLIDGIQGYPLYLGILMDRVADVPHINNVQFNPNNWIDCYQSLRDWVNSNAISLKMRAADDFMINSFFSYGYYCGMWFDTYLADTNYPGSSGSLNLFGFDGAWLGMTFSDRGISTWAGVTISNGLIAPVNGPVGARAGIKFSDTQQYMGPGVSINNVSIFGPHDHSIWIEANSYARVSVVGGQMTQYVNDMVLCMGANAIVRLIGVRSMGGNGPRIYNPGGSDISDLAPITS
jgi:hypothetical protein